MSCEAGVGNAIGDTDLRQAVGAAQSQRGLLPTSLNGGSRLLRDPAEEIILGNLRVHADLCTANGQLIEL
jgi:hypothetical protein